jgi:rhodanese-related sulfurtransferase
VANLTGFLVLAFGIALWFVPEAYARLRGVRGVTPGALRKALAARPADLVVLDVRSAGEFARGHIPGARHLPLERVGDGAALLGNLKGSRVVCVCATGKRSAVAAVRLKAAGFANVYNLSGGMLFWGRRDVEAG